MVLPLEGRSPSIKKPMSIWSALESDRLPLYALQCSWAVGMIAGYPARFRLTMFVRFEVIEDVFSDSAPSVPG